ncbi:MAG TPA: MotA/TolQ/ExbB proton channel family protein [Syntrophales bacterium]|nr:MotA/TolQ/ExbB proton channel family protein [Syntrophales bacterium]HPX55158.1 MotA/TolQ/ExbB proton channel family protein [Syntrophales bacterium]HQA81868.1 MotA/TolQ/ExbB proton channel family protein [Syntrophales bacterium]
MDIATIIGIIGGFTLVITAMGWGGGLSWFLDLPSMMIVLGGTFGAVLINYPLSTVVKVIPAAKNIFFKRETEVQEVIELFVEMAGITRREGLLSLERMEAKIEDPFLSKAVGLVLDGVDPTDVEIILETEIQSVAERHRIGAEIFTTMGNFAPAMGLMGTLIGLVKMLMQMSDPAMIGPSMSLALITTFYGVILSNLVFLPIAGKLKTQSSHELFIKYLMLNGTLAMQSGDHPRMVKQKLLSFVAPRERGAAY